MNEETMKLIKLLSILLVANFFSFAMEKEQEQPEQQTLLFDKSRPAQLMTWINEKIANKNTRLLFLIYPDEVAQLTK